MAYQQKSLSEVTSGKLTKKELTQERDEDGKSKLHLAAFVGDLSQIPPETFEDLDLLLNTKDNRERNIFHAVTQSPENFGDQLPKILKSYFQEPKILEIPDSDGNSIVHYLAKIGQLNLVPIPVLIQHPKLLTQNNKEGQIPLHLVAENTTIGRFPEEFVTQKAINTQDKQGNTPLHVAAVRGFFREFPQKILTVSNLINLKNDEGMNPLDIFVSWEWNDDSEAIPLPIWSKYVPDTQEKKKTYQKFLSENPRFEKELRIYKKGKKIRNTQTQINFTGP